MIRGKQLLIALMLLSALMITAIVLDRDPFKQARKPDLSGLLPGRAEGSIDKILISSKEGNVTLEKRGDLWWILEPRELRADDVTVKSVASALEKMNLTELVSRKKERHSEYGLGEDQPERAQVKAFSSGIELLDFTLGKQTPDMQGTFVSLTKEPDGVYVAKPFLPRTLNQGISAWRYKFVLDLDESNVDRIQIETGKGILDLAKAPGGSWKKRDDSSWVADKDRVDQLLSGLARLPYVEVIDEPGVDARYGFGNPSARVTLSAAGWNYVLILGKETASGGNFWIKVEGMPAVYQVRKTVAERFSQDFDFYRSGNSDAKVDEKPASN